MTKEEFEKLNALEGHMELGFRHPKTNKWTRHFYLKNCYILAEDGKLFKESKYIFIIPNELKVNNSWLKIDKKLEKKNLR